MNDKTPTIKLIFKWTGFSPDHRQYKPSNPNITCDIPVIIDVPLSLDLIVNSTQIISAQLTNQKEEFPILTPLGMRYCIDQFESVMSNTVKDEKEKSVAEDTSNWDSGESDQPAEKSDKATWDDFEEEEKSETKDEKWDETWETQK